MKRILSSIIKWLFPKKEPSNDKNTKSDKRWSERIKSGQLAMLSSLDSKNSWANLTEDEKRWIRVIGLCPDCKTGNLLEGPSGGICTNFLCDTCESKFNISVPFGETNLLTAHRI